MSDVFISYARSTAAQAGAAAEALRSAGYSVWLDEDLPAHRPYAREIEAQLKAAKAALVIWSAEAVESEWVLSEANRARADRKLVQVNVDGAALPMPFDQIQSADVAGWTGEAGHAGWRKAMASIAELAGVVGAGPDTPPAAPPPAGGNLPRRLGAIIGREAELAQIAAMLEESDLVTVTGTGGVGKTRLVVEAGLAGAERFRDGAWLVELAPISDPKQVPSAVARAMSLDIASGGEDAQGALIEGLKPRDCLIILDNCEHLIDAVAGLAEAILERSTRVKLLASSQELLDVEGERVFREVLKRKRIGPPVRRTCAGR